MGTLLEWLAAGLDPTVVAIILVQEFKSVGADVIVIGYPRPKPLLFGRTHNQRLFTNRRWNARPIMRERPSAPRWPSAVTRFLGVHGFDRLDGSTANLTSHAVLVELATYVQALVSAVLD